MPEKIDFTASPNSGYNDYEKGSIIYDSEVEDWKKIYPQINVRRTLELVKELAKMEADAGAKLYKKDEEGKIYTTPYKGEKTLWGSKREIMMLFDENRENNGYFKGYSKEIQDKIREINIDDYIKNS